MAIRVDHRETAGKNDLWVVYMQRDGKEIPFSTVDKSTRHGAKANLTHDICGYWFDAKAMIEISEALMKTIELLQEGEAK